MFNKILIGAALTLAMTAQANAINFSSTFTGDNNITEFNYSAGGTTFQSFDLTSISDTNNLNNWKKSNSLSLTNLVNASSYDFIWKTTNNINEGKNDGNPAAFLAQFTLGDNTSYTSNDAMWSLSTDGINWSNTYLANFRSGDSDAFNGGDNIWGASGGTISGISTDAQWIWAEANGANINNNELYIKASVVSPVSEPATAMLMLAGLVGIAGFAARRNRNQSAATKATSA